MEKVNLLVNFTIEVPNGVKAEELCINIRHEKIEILGPDLRPIIDAKILEYETIDLEDGE